MEIIVLPTAVGVFECVLPRVWDTLGICAGVQGAGVGMAGERDPTVFQPCYPNRTFPQWCQKDSSAVTGQEVFVELSDLCRVLWLCGVTTCNCAPGRLLGCLRVSYGSSAALRDEQEPKKMQIADEEAFLSVCDWLPLVPVCSSQPWFLCSSSPSWPAFALTHSLLLFSSGLGFTWFYG